ncbi:hypothetical protein AGMMS49944_22990 [Spirochaetia bacterium]|nr:hypothetical protein AGMMS49944_22990 [Spirochaetia bacterium]
MTEDLLDAECVIGQLCDQNVISRASWKNSHPNDQEYSVYFNHLGSVGEIHLWIIKRSGEFYISRSLITILSCRHRFNADTIFTLCKVA